MRRKSQFCKSLKFVLFMVSLAREGQSEPRTQRDDAACHNINGSKRAGRLFSFLINDVILSEEVSQVYPKQKEREIKTVFTHCCKTQNAVRRTTRTFDTFFDKGKSTWNSSKKTVIIFFIYKPQLMKQYFVSNFAVKYWYSVQTIQFTALYPTTITN